MNAGRKEESDICLEIYKKLLMESALKNSNKVHQQSMLNNIPLHQKILKEKLKNIKLVYRLI